MRKFPLAVLAAALLALAGCGGGHPKPATALDDAVGYFSKDAPLVAAVQTDPNGAQVKQALALLGRFPVASVLAGRAQSLAGLNFVDWSRDVRPQLGAPLVIGLARPAAGSGLGAVTLVAMRVKHPLRVKQVLLRQPNFRGGKKTSGVRIYDNTAQHR